MLFSTFDYFVFLPLVATAHWVVGDNRWRTRIILAASAAFYLAWNPLDSFILLYVGTAAFVSGRLLHAHPPAGTVVAETTGSAVAAVPAPRRQATGLPSPLWVAAFAILAPLLFYKYVHFGLTNLALLVPAIPVLPKQHLPIGISFYSFQALAYVIDVRRGQAAERDPVRFATFLCFFPHLVAGPILRAANLLGQLGAARSLSRADVGYGVFRLCLGLAKKLLVADVLRVGVVDSVFTDPSAFTGPEILVALYAYTLQIYCDFSGYTDFAIGSARLIGFSIPENFDRPYQALSVANYWRRWHITLSDWVRDYVYYPLGGSRGAGIRPYINTMATLLILGTWHGANWTFIVYGALHGVAVSLNRLWKRRAGWVEPRGLGVAWRWLLTFQFIVTARILFRADDLDHAWRVWIALGEKWEWAMPRYSYHAWAVLLVGYVVHLSPKRWMLRLREGFSLSSPVLWGLALAATAFVVVRFGVGDSLAFIYDSF